MRGLHVVGILFMKNTHVEQADVGVSDFGIENQNNY